MLKTKHIPASNPSNCEGWVNKDQAGAKALLAVGAAPADASVPAAELAAWTAVANIILNMDEVITRN